MAANEYVQAAAAQLQTGATAIKSEIDQMRAEFMTYERQANGEISSKEDELRNLNAQLMSGPGTPANAVIHARIQHLQKDIGNLKHQMVDRKNQLNNAIRGKEGAMNDLMNQSRGLQNKAASLK